MPLGGILAASPDYLLSADEQRLLQPFLGRQIDGLIAGNGEASRVVKRVFHAVAGPIRFGKKSLERDYAMGLAVPDRLRLENDRFLVGSGCLPHACDTKSGFVIDRATGHVALLMLHYGGKATGRYWAAGSLTVMHKDCANRELVDFATGYFERWTDVVRKDRAAKDGPAVLIETSPCVQRRPVAKK